MERLLYILSHIIQFTHSIMCNGLIFTEARRNSMELGTLVLTICAVLMAFVVCLGIFAVKVYK